MYINFLHLKDTEVTQDILVVPLGSLVSITKLEILRFILFLRLNMLMNSISFCSRLVQVLRQRTQCSIPKQQINILQTNLLSLLEEEEYNGECDAYIPSYDQ